MAKHTIFITTDNDMSDTSLQELANAILMWKHVVGVEVIKEAVQLGTQARALEAERIKQADLLCDMMYANLEMDKASRR